MLGQLALWSGRHAGICAEAVLEKSRNARAYPPADSGGRLPGIDIAQRGLTQVLLAEGAGPPPGPARASPVPCPDSGQSGPSSETVLIADGTVDLDLECVHSSFVCDTAAGLILRAAIAGVAKIVLPQW